MERLASNIHANAVVKNKSAVFLFIIYILRI